MRKKMLEATISIEDYLEINLLTLREHTEAAGDQMEAEHQRQLLTRALAVSEVCEVRRSNAVVAYAMLRLEANGCWFVGAFNIHPAHQNAGVFSALARDVIKKIDEFSIVELRSNVYKTNLKSMKFHRRLGFIVTRENAKGVEFRVPVTAILASSVASRITQTDKSRS